MRLADFILANVEPILAEWEAFARSIWPSGATAEPAELRDDAEDILRATALDMQSDQTSAQQAEKSKGAGRAGDEGGGLNAGVVIPRGRRGWRRASICGRWSPNTAPFGPACSGCGAKAVRPPTCATWMT